jgi:prophage regulatory protein
MLKRVSTPPASHAQSIEPEPAFRFLRLPRVKDRVGLGRSSIYALIGNGEFPRPISLGGRAVAWLESDIDGWIQTKIEAARQR